MTSAMVNIRTSPRRMLTSLDAAEYCGIPVRYFFTQRSFPKMQMPNGSQLHDISDLDSWINGLKGDAQENDASLLITLTSN